MGSGYDPHFESKVEKPSIFLVFSTHPTNPTSPPFDRNTPQPCRVSARYSEPSLPMANVKRSTPVTVPAPAPAPAPLDPGATAAMAKKSASTGAAITATKSPAAASPLIVIEIPSSPDASTGGRRSTTKARKRPALWPLVLDDEIEMWTPREKRRLDEDCQILAGDPLASNIEVAPAAASDEIAVVAERGKVRLRLRQYSRG